jgi:hypothetical protein
LRHSYVNTLCALLYRARNCPGDVGRSSRRAGSVGDCVKHGTVRYDCDFDLYGLVARPSKIASATEPKTTAAVAS